MPLTPIFHPQEDWYQAMVTKNKGSLKATNRQEEWYEEIVDSMSSGSGGGGLPPVTASDAGKVLAVDNSGVWVAQTPASGGGVLVVTEARGELNKTWQEIRDAMRLGGAVISFNDNDCKQVDSVGYAYRTEEYSVETKEATYITNSASGYPQRT